MDILSQNPALILISLISLLTAVLIITLVVIQAFVFISKWLKFLEKEQNKDAEKIKSKAYAEATKILEEAKSHSVKIIEEANSKAQQTLAEAKIISSDTESELKTAIQELSNKNSSQINDTARQMLEVYKKMVESQKEDSLNALSMLTKDVEHAVDAEIDIFKDKLEKETIGVEKEVEKRVDEKYKEVEKDIELYKEQKLKLIDSQIYELLVSVSKVVLGKAISLQDHQQLVITALENAKLKLQSDHGQSN